MADRAQKDHSETNCSLEMRYLKVGFEEVLKAQNKPYTLSFKLFSHVFQTTIIYLFIFNTAENIPSFVEDIKHCNTVFSP